jgi:hypothetical protein
MAKLLRVRAPVCGGIQIEKASGPPDSHLSVDR